MRDEDLISDNFFDIAKYPKMKFVSTSISKGSEGYVAKGSLTIKKTTKTVSIPFRVENQVFKGKFVIDRLDYEVGESNWLMGDDVTVFFELPVTGN